MTLRESDVPNGCDTVSITNANTCKTSSKEYQSAIAKY